MICMGLKLGLSHRYVGNRVLRSGSEAMRAEVRGGWRGEMRGLTHCNTMPAVRRAEPSMPLLLILVFCQ